MKIVQADGLTGAAHGGVSDNGPNLADQLVNSALRYRAQAPILEGLLKEIGMDGRTLGGLAGGATGQEPPSKDR